MILPVIARNPRALLVIFIRRCGDKGERQKSVDDDGDAWKPIINQSLSQSHVLPLLLLLPQAIISTIASLTTCACILSGTEQRWTGRHAVVYRTTVSYAFVHTHTHTHTHCRLHNDQKLCDTKTRLLISCRWLSTDHHVTPFLSEMIENMAHIEWKFAL